MLTPLALQSLLSTLAKGTTPAGDVTSTGVDSNTQALDVLLAGAASLDATALAAINAITTKLSSDPATQTTLAAILAKLSDPATQTTLAAVLAKLSSDPSTATLQASANTKLDTLHADFGTLGSFVDGLETLATALNGYVDGIEGLTGALTETAPTTDTASSGLNGRLQRVAQRLTSLIALLPPTIGPTTKAGSLSTTTATDDPLISQVGIVTETAPASDTASSGLNGRLQRIAQRLTSLIALLPAAIGPTTKSGALSITTATDDPMVSQVGGVTETAPASDTASSGLNGRLQRIAQRLSSLIALLPTALGAGGGLKIDGSGTALPVSVADGSNVAIGAVADAAASAGGTGTLSAKLRRISTQLPAAVGQGAMSASMAVAVASDQSAIKSAPQTLIATGTTLTRPANTTAYTAGDSISDNATAGSVTAQPITFADVNDAPVWLEEILLDTNDTGLGAGAQIAVYVYNSDPTASTGVGAGDNAAFSNKKAGFVGRLSGTFRQFSDGGKARCTPDEGTFIPLNPGSGARTFWVQYQALSGFTPSGNSTTIIPMAKGFQGRA